MSDEIIEIYPKERNLKMNNQNRRDFLKASLAASTALVAAPNAFAMPAEACCAVGQLPGSKMKLGLVTYLWGKDWDLPTLIANCEKSGFKGVELRVDHAHKVSAKLTAAERKAVKKQFKKSKVTFLGMGCNWDFHHTDPAKVKANIEGAKGI